MAVLEYDETDISYQVLALSFREPGAIEFFADNLPPEAVQASGHYGLAQFYEAILHFYDKTGVETLDPIAFKHWLALESDIHEALGGPTVVEAFLDTLMSIEMSTAESVTAILRYRLNKRKQLGSLQELQQILTKKGATSEDENSRISTLTDQIRGLEKELGYNPLSRVTTASQIAENAERLFDLPDFLPTQFPSLNKALGYTKDAGMCKGAVHAIIAQSGKGKSTFAKCLMNHWCEQGYTGIFVNFEEAKAHWERILFTQITSQNVYLSKNLSIDARNDLLDTFKEKMDEWGDRFMVRHDLDTPYYDDLELWLRDIIAHNEKPPDFLIIDTIQSMFMKGSGGKPRWGQFEEIMVRLEKLAKDMNSVIIITAQENANRMRERREVVQQSDTGGSLTIVQKSAVTIFITQRNLDNAHESEDDTIMELQIPKNRITGETYRKDPPLVQYFDDTKTYKAYEYVEEYQPLHRSFEAY